MYYFNHKRVLFLNKYKQSIWWFLFLITFQHFSKQNYFIAALHVLTVPQGSKYTNNDHLKSLFFILVKPKSNYYKHNLFTRYLY